MNKTGWSYIKRATGYEKYEMECAIEDMNQFEQQEPHGIDENDNDCPITYRLECHKGWQATAYTPNGKLMGDGSFSNSFVRCGNCGEIFTWGGEDTIICPHCFIDYSEE